MLFKEMNREELLKLSNKLDQALFNHQIWFNSLLRTLLCKLPPDQHDLLLEAHKDCRFGQWFYSEDNKDLMEYPGFKALGEAHMTMHQMARNLLNTIHTGTAVSPLDYDQFSNALSRMHLEIQTLKREVENILNNCDPLTGAINRANMLTLLREQYEISKQENQPSFLAMMSFDYLKKINDQYGHGVGDNILMSAIHFILQNLRPYDKIFRYDGEEFLIYLNTEQKTALEWIENIREHFSQTDLLQKPTSIRSTVSFGVAPLELYSSVEQSVDHSKKALLAAGSSGGNCIVVWNPTMM